MIRAGVGSVLVGGERAIEVQLGPQCVAVPIGEPMTGDLVWSMRVLFSI
jgi:hypothetical protein